MLLRLGNPVSTSGPEPPPARDSFLDLSSSSLSLEPQPQEKHNSSTANAEPMLENGGSISGPAPLAFVLESQQKHNSPNANTRPLLENIGSTSGPEPFPDGTAPEVGEILGRNEAQGLQHNSMRSQEYSWSPPPSSWLKFNVGAEVHYSAFLAAVVRDEAGNVVNAETAIGNVTSSLEADALAFQCGVHLIKQYSVRKAIIEGDAPLVVNALNRKTDAQLEIKGTVQEVFTTLDTLTDTTVDFSCVHKSCNSLVYDCIKWASRNGFSGILPIGWFKGDSFIGPSCV
ncbi:uncharacterized protein LOC136065558 [Quercus suber]|uniref:uncharacterized protein LOC136065558 n=1 Tax=Quercus suber TaxID=58331 RepID=UPI0032E04148